MIQYILFMICISLCCVLIAYIIDKTIIIAKAINYIINYILKD